MLAAITKKLSLDKIGLAGQNQVSTVISTYPLSLQFYLVSFWDALGL